MMDALKGSMTEAEKEVRDISRLLGGAVVENGRRELTKSHATKNGRHPRDETRRDQSGQTVATAQSQIAHAL